MEIMKQKYNVVKKIGVDHKIYISKNGELTSDGTGMYHPINVEVRFNGKSSLFRSRINDLIPLPVDYKQGDKLPEMLLNKSGKINLSKVNNRLKVFMDIEKLSIEHLVLNSNYIVDDNFTPTLWLNEYTIYCKRKENLLGYEILRDMTEDLIEYFVFEHEFEDLEAINFVPDNIYLIGNFVSCLIKLGVYDITKDRLQKFNAVIAFINKIKSLDESMPFTNLDFISGGLRLLIYNYSDIFFNDSKQDLKIAYLEFVERHNDPLPSIR